MKDTVAVWVILVVLVGHWVFDFVLQPHWMSMRKSKDWAVLALHAAVITTGGLAVGIAIKYFGGYHYSTHAMWLVLGWAALNGGAHFAIDAVTSRITGRLWREERVHDFFVVIGFDQLLHVGLALGTIAWLVAT